MQCKLCEGASVMQGWFLRQTPTRHARAPPVLLKYLQMTKFNKKVVANDYILAMCACNCCKAVQARSLQKAGWTAGHAYNFPLAQSPAPLPCPCCNDDNKSEMTKQAMQLIKEHMQGHRAKWLVVAELPILPGRKRIDAVIVPELAETFAQVIAVESDPNLHFENPSQHAHVGVDRARDAAMDRDEVKDKNIEELGIHSNCILRLTSQSIKQTNMGWQIDARWLAALDACIEHVHSTV
jgi:hypothetical protein